MKRYCGDTYFCFLISNNVCGGNCYVSELILWSALLHCFSHHLLQLVHSFACFNWNFESDFHFMQLLDLLQIAYCCSLFVTMFRLEHNFQQLYNYRKGKWRKLILNLLHMCLYFITILIIELSFLNWIFCIWIFLETCGRKNEFYLLTIDSSQKKLLTIDWWVNVQLNPLLC